MKTTKEKRDVFVNAGSEIEKELYQLFKKEEPLILADIGACDGLSSIIYLKMFPNAIVHSFEPVEENWQELVANLHEYGMEKRYQAYPFALGNHKGEVQFWRSHGQDPRIVDWDTGNKSGSLRVPALHLKEHPTVKFSSSKVKVVRLDDIFHESQRIDFAHIDVQGSEIEVLRGGARTFKQTRAIWIECCNIELYHGQPLKQDISRYLDSIGMKCMKDDCPKQKSSGDMLWVRPWVINH